MAALWVCVGLNPAKSTVKLIRIGDRPRTLEQDRLKDTLPQQHQSSRPKGEPLLLRSTKRSEFHSQSPQKRECLPWQIRFQHSCPVQDSRSNPQPPYPRTRGHFYRN